MSLRKLPARPNLELLKKQARTLLQECLAADPAAIERLAVYGIVTPPKLADTLHVLAREYGYDTWPALKLHVETNVGDPLQALSSAIKANNAAAVHQLLARHPSLRSSLNEALPDSGFGAPALFAAVEQENHDMIGALLDAGADIDNRTKWWAGSFGVLDSASPEVASYLISRGAQVDIHAAARLGMIGRVRELLAADANLVHSRGGDGQLALHFASNVEIAALLLDHGADVNALDIDHESNAAQYMACIAPMRGLEKSHRHEVARFLVSKGAQTDILMASALGDLALVENILDGDPDTVRTTVSERYFPKQNPQSGGCIYIYGFGQTKSAHMIAHEFGHTSVFELLMRRSPPWLRLSQAAELGDGQLVEQTLRQHPSLISRLSPAAARHIVGATLRNNTRAVDLLLKAGWPPTAALENNQTALHYAAWHGNLVMVNALLQHGAPVNVFESEHGGSPLAWALHGSLNSWEREKGDYPGVTRALLAAGGTIPKPNGPLEASEEVLELLLQHKP